MVTLLARNALVVSVLGFGWSLDLDIWFYVGVFGRNVASVTMKRFLHLTYFIKKFYKYHIFSVIGKDSSALNCITVQHKKFSCLSTLMSHMMLVTLYFVFSSLTYERKGISEKFVLVATDIK